MKVTIVEDNEYYLPMLKELLPGTLVCFQKHVYIKMDKGKLGCDIQMNWPKGNSILINPKYGSHRSVPADTRVQVLEQCNNLEVCRIMDKRDLVQHLRSDFICR